VGLAVEISIFLQTPEEEGGYGFTPLQNDACTSSLDPYTKFMSILMICIDMVCQWLGLALCQLCGSFLNDRIPLWVSRRYNGAWRLEYCLYPIFLAALASPVGFGIFGAGLQ